MTAYEDQVVNAYRSDRLVYRAVENNPEDRAFVADHLLNDPVNATMAGARYVRPVPLREAEAYIKGMQAASLLFVLICLAPEDAKDDSTDGGRTPEPVPIGQIGFYKVPGTDAHHRTATLGVELATPYRGKGYGPEAINWALDWAFRRADLHRVGLSAWGFNSIALKLYSKLGFVEEGRQREAIYYDRQLYDIVIYGMLEQDWAKLRGLEY